LLVYESVDTVPPGPSQVSLVASHDALLPALPKLWPPVPPAVYEARIEAVNLASSRLEIGRGPVVFMS
jgi:hypothetical protein